MLSMKWIKIIGLIGVSCLFLSACGGEKEENEDIPNDVEEDLEEEVEEPSYLNTYPLTGIGTDEEINNRVVGVSINNHPAARPQSGIADADIVYEVLTEGEMTRFVAIFHSQLPERVGPVRSARPYLIDLVKGYNGVYIAHGWSPEAEKILKSGYIDHLNGLFYDGSLFKRSSDRKAPHNSYITFENIAEGMNSLGFEETDEVKTALSFYEENEEHLNGSSGTEIEINYLNQNNVRYEYDEEEQLYNRFNGETQTTDYETEEPVQIANVLAIEADHQILDDVGRRAVDLKAGGEAILFQNGTAINIQWKNEGGQVIPILDGEPVLLKPGKTWINIIPSSPGISTSVTY